MEIERKFLVKSLPLGWKKLVGSPIRQGYFALRDQNVEIRLREKGSEWFITVKAGHGRNRLEEEIRIPEAQFKQLWPLVQGTSLTKTRYRIREADNILELDIYRGRHRGLKIVEVEFPSIPKCDSFEPPKWVGEEVTGNRHFANATLARTGRLPPKRLWHSNSKRRNRRAKR